MIALCSTKFSEDRSTHPENHLEKMPYPQNLTVKMCDIVDCSSLIRFYTSFEHIMPEVPQKFKATRLKVKVTA